MGPSSNLESSVLAGGVILDCNQDYREVVDEDTSNRSSSGSAISSLAQWRCR
ncbi:unnamed protein product [Dovyalis caffra]|uniref:Uncharacterized protein n=1 Tax=Dovyalis caffra TaxID=77055 RepID=A0AAV1QRT5_9ROSI|nr:unnamed protein product [Dovyalis caffra]